MRHGASMINMGVRNQHELDVPGIKAKLVDRFLDDFTDFCNKCARVGPVALPATG
jgi:hypothetical protein